MQTDYEVLWQEYQAPPPGGKRGRWVKKSEAFESSDEALDFMLDLKGDGARNIEMRAILEPEALITELEPVYDPDGDPDNPDNLDAVDDTKGWDGSYFVPPAPI